LQREHPWTLYWKKWKNVKIRKQILDGQSGIKTIMKNIYLIGGTMGVGKTTVCQILKKKLPDCVFLDGDWCWDMQPFRVTPETKKMVMENICFLLNQFIHCSAYENIIFCWVMHEQAIMDEIISKLETGKCLVHTISLICDADVLRKRLQKDIDAGIRSEDIIQRSIARIGLYEKLNTEKIDVTHITPELVAEKIIKKAGQPQCPAEKEAGLSEAPNSSEAVMALLL